MTPDTKKQTKHKNYPEFLWQGSTYDLGKNKHHPVKTTSCLLSMFMMTGEEIFLDSLNYLINGNRETVEMF